MRHVGEEAHVGITHALDDRLFAQRLLDAASVAQVVGGQQRSVGNGKCGEKGIDQPSQPPCHPPGLADDYGHGDVADGLAVLVESPCLEGIAARVE